MSHQALRHPRIAFERALAFAVRRLPPSVLLALSGRPQDERDGQKLDPEAQLLCSLASRLRRPMNELSPEVARREYRESSVSVGPSLRRQVTHADRFAPGPAGPIPLRIFRPAGVPAPAPVLVYFHGGGFVIGDLDTHDPLCRVVAEDAGCIVVAVDYRLAPEHPFPAAVDDAIAAYLWVARNAASFGGDPARLAVGGDSAGGSLTAVVALATRETGPKPCFQLLLYPVCDVTMTLASHRTFENGYLLTGALMRWFRDHYLPDAADHRDWRASPLFATDLGGSPPALIVTAGYDPLRDEGRAYAARLEEAGVPVRYRCFEGLVHGFAAMTGVLGAAIPAVSFASAALAEGLSLPRARPGAISAT